MNRILTLIALAVLVAPKFVQATLLGVDFSGTAYLIDENTGAGAVLGATGFTRLNSAAADGAGTIFSATQQVLLGDSELITVDSTTGGGTSVTPTFDAVNGVRGLAFSSGGSLFAVIDQDAGGGIGPDSLFTVDTVTGVLTNVGATGLTDIQGLAFDSADNLFGWDVDVGLVSIDTTTGAATDLSPADGSTDIQTLEFAPDGTLYGARDELFTIDPITGIPTLVGSGGYSDVRGIAFLADSVGVPGPGTAFLLSIGLIAPMFARSRRV